MAIVINTLCTIVIYILYNNKIKIKILVKLITNKMTDIYCIERAKGANSSGHETDLLGKLCKLTFCSMTS